VVALSEPELPDGFLLALRFPDTGVEYRIAEDGRYLVNGEPKPPVNESEPGAQVLSPEALARLRGALDDDGFFDLPAEVPGGDVAGVVLHAGGGAPALRPVVLSARAADGSVHTVSGAGDPRAAFSFGRLAHVYETLDREALGGWMRE
jgi:hypothetical protein